MEPDLPELPLPQLPPKSEEMPSPDRTDAALELSVKPRTSGKDANQDVLQARTSPVESQGLPSLPSLGNAERGDGIKPDSFFTKESPPVETISFPLEFHAPKSLPPLPSLEPSAMKSFVTQLPDFTESENSRELDTEIVHDFVDREKSTSLDGPLPLTTEQRKQKEERIRLFEENRKKPIEPESDLFEPRGEEFSSSPFPSIKLPSLAESSTGFGNGDMSVTNDLLRDIIGLLEEIRDNPGGFR